MSKWYLAWKNLMHHPSRFIFNILLIGMAVSLLVMILLINKQCYIFFSMIGIPPVGYLSQCRKK